MLKCDEVTVGCAAVLIIIACFVMGFSLNSFVECQGMGACTVNKDNEKKVKQIKRLKKGSVAMFTVSGAVAVLCVLSLLFSMYNKMGVQGMADDVMGAFF